MAIKEYRFAKKKDELATEIIEAVYDFQDNAIDKGYAKGWIKNQDYIEGKFYESYPGDDIIDIGEQGEQKAMFFNEFRNFYTHTYNLVTANTPAFTVTAANTDIESKKSAQVAKRVVDHYHKVQGFESLINNSTKKGIGHGDGYLTIEWDPTIGDKIAQVDGKFTYKGDFHGDVKTVWNVFFDYNKDSKKDWDWAIFRKKKNRFDLAATFPEKKDKILAINDFRNTDRYWQYLNNVQNDESKESDDIWVYSFYHKATPAVPKGVYAMVAGDDKNSQVMLYEGANGNFYKDKLPIFNIAPDEYMTECFGFTDLNSCRGPQELNNVILSSIATNAIAAGSQNIYAGQSGSNLDIQSTVDGMNFFYADVEPKVLDFYQENPGLFNIINTSKQFMETATGMNSVVRGDVAGAPNLKSGVAIATVINMAAQYSMGLVKSYNKMFEDVYTFMIDILKVVANEERLIEIVGKRRASDVEMFTKEDLSGVSRVVVQMVNPISKSPAGAMEIGMELLKMEAITIEQYFDIINTGNIDFATENLESLTDLITAYKDALLEGKPMPAVPGINSRLFMKEIQSVLTFDVLTNPEKQNVLQNTLKLLNDQMEFVRNGDEVAEYIYGGQIPQPQPQGGNIPQVVNAGNPNQPKPAVQPAQPQAGANLGGQ